MARSAVIIGSGIGGLATACILGKAGYEVTVLEKNKQLGGRAGQLKVKGFTFDTGPSWYLMPDVFEHFFSLLGENVSDHLKLSRLHPGYRVFYKDRGQHIDQMGHLSIDKHTFETIEPGAGEQLERYLDRSTYAYDFAMKHLLYKNHDSLRGIVSRGFVREMPRMNLHDSIHTYVARHFKDPRLQQILQFPLVFLGTDPHKGPALYSLMSHIDFRQGVFYPEGGMYSVVEALVALGKKFGVAFQTEHPVSRIIVKDEKAVGVQIGDTRLDADIVISNADVHHTDTALLEKQHREYPERYWHKRTVAPSALLLFLGVDRQYQSLLHHNLLFSKNWRQNFVEIFNSQTLPQDPSLYVCAPSRTDESVAPKGHENMFVLVPLAAGLTYTEEQLEAFSSSILATIETEMHLTDLRKHIVYRKQFCVRDFAEQFNSHQGSALGLSHTLGQTALFRPRNKSKKVRDLYYVGANVHPGIGMGSTLISAELLYKRLINDSTSRPLDSLSFAS